MSNSPGSLLGGYHPSHMKARVHVRTEHGTDATLGWTDGPSVTIDGSPEVGSMLLCLAVGGCYANTLLGEAAKRGIGVRSVEVDVETEWVDNPARTQGVTLSVRVDADADEPAIMDHVEHTDKIAEVANSLRLGTPVRVTDAHVIARR